MGKEKKQRFEDLLLDDAFISFVKGRHQDVPEWLETNKNDPEQAKEIEKATELANTFKRNHKTEPPLNKESAANVLLQKLRFEEKIKKRPSSKNLTFINYWSVAASILLVVALGVIAYFMLPASALITDGPKYHEVIVPTGEKTQVILADGSVIWLNAESRFKYPEKFTGTAREVILEGEAFFDVKKDKNTPFIVHTEEVEVKVLGTEFNIKNYPGEDILEATVVDGSVLLSESSETYSFNPVVLNRNEKATLVKSDKSLLVESTLKKQQKAKTITKNTAQEIKKKAGITIKKVNTEPIISWKDHLLVFDNETLGDMAVKMTRWYKIPVIIQDTALMNERYTGKFVNNETVYQVLSAIRVTTPIKFETKDNTIIISKKKK